MIKSALIVSPPYARLIASGQKRWELRSKPCNKREEVGIIEAGSGTIVGVATVVATHGPLSSLERENAAHLHLVSIDDLAGNPHWIHAWEFERAQQLKLPVPYDHPNGAQWWVTIDNLTALRIAYQTEPTVRKHLSGSHAA